jgi:hypothetical protein
VNRRPVITAAIYNACLTSDIPNGSAAVFIDSSAVHIGVTIPIESVTFDSKSCEFTFQCF